MFYVVKMDSKLAMIVALLAIVAMVPTPVVQAQGEKARHVSSEFIPVDGMATGLLNPARVLASPSLKMFPTEIADAWCIENIGIPLKDVESIKLVVATPGPSDAMFGGIFQFGKNVDLKTLHPQFLGDEVEVDGHACIEFNGPPGVVLHQLRPDAIVIASKNYLDSVIKSKSGQATAPLQKYAEGAVHDGQLTLLIAVEPVRPLITGLLQSQMDQIPPPFVEFTEIPELLDAILLQLDIENTENGLKLVMLGVDDASTKRLEEILLNGLDMARIITLSQMSAELDRQEGAVPQAMKRYMERMADKVVGAMTPKREGRRLTIESPLDYGLSYQAVMMMGLAMPVMRVAPVARQPRARARNNMKQIALAMHNHHSAYRELPDAAIRDDEGKPLLSWRVKVLPFVEQQALYEQFRLDEPWDSDHNRKLLGQMPDVFRSPRINTKPGMTVYQVPFGDGLMFSDNGPTRFRDVLDGLSNSIMLVETDAELAVEWTKPADWEVDPDKPLKGIGIGPDGNIDVLLADGSIHSLSSEIEADFFWRLLTIAGAEIIQLD